MQDGHLRFRQRHQALNGIAQRELGGQLRLGHSIGPGGGAKPGIAGPIADRIDPADARHRFRVLDRPVISQQVTLAPRHEADLGGQPVILDLVLVEPAVDLGALRLVEGIADTRSPHVEALLQQARESPDNALGTRRARRKITTN